MIEVLIADDHASVREGIRLIRQWPAIAVPQLDNLDVPPSQVLQIVYANRNPGAGNGGFFPGGFNGTIRTV